MAAALVFGLLWIALLIGRGTASGDALHRVMVGWPALLANRITRVQLVLAVVVLALVVLHAIAGDDDPIRLLGLVAPEIAIWFASVEIGALLEAAAALVASVSMIRRIGIVRVLHRLRAGIAGQAIRRIKRPRSARRKPAPPANDDDHHADIASAA